MRNEFNNNFSILKYSTQVEDAFHEKPDSKKMLYSLLWVTDGMVELVVDGSLVSINAGQMAAFTPANHVRIIETHGDVSILQFDRAFYCIRENDQEVSCEGILFNGTNGIPIIHLGDQETKSFDRLLGVLEEEFEVKDTIQEEMLRVVLKRWLIKSTRILKMQHNYVSAGEQVSELFRQFNILVEKNYRRYHKVKEYAELLNKSPKTIANQFKLIGQDSPSAIIQNRVALEAKRYLLYSALSIKEIAYRLGFVDATSFSHFFKNRFDVSPKSYKKAYGKT